MNTKNDLTDGADKNEPLKKNWSAPEVVLISNKGDGIDAKSVFSHEDGSAGPSS